MKTKLYCIFDRKTTLYHVPFHAHNTGHAIRIFSDMASDAQSQVQTWPEDFELYEIGDFNNENGCVTPLTVPHFVINATSVLEGPGKGTEELGNAFEGMRKAMDKETEKKLNKRWKGGKG